MSEIGMIELLDFLCSTKYLVHKSATILRIICQMSSLYEDDPESLTSLYLLYDDVTDSLFSLSKLLEEKFLEYRFYPVDTEHVSS